MKAAMLLTSVVAIFLALLATITLVSINLEVTNYKAGVKAERDRIATPYEDRLSAVKIKPLHEITAADEKDLDTLEEMACAPLPKAIIDHERERLA